MFRVVSPSICELSLDWCMEAYDCEAAIPHMLVVELVFSRGVIHAVCSCVLMSMISAFLYMYLIYFPCIIEASICDVYFEGCHISVDLMTHFIAIF